MCGICGIFSLSARDDIDPRVLDDMNRRLAHRGPDDSGTFTAPGVGLGIRRLEVIDLVSGHQPIQNEDGRLTIVYNGEVYNFADLRAPLEARGHVFKTRTDTEVVLHLYEDEGPAALEKLNGMFALAIYDRRDHSLFLARDRMGIKPLYYAHLGDTLLFASEPKSALAHPALTRDIDPHALAEYLANEFVAAPRTIYKHLRKLPPGSHLLIKKGTGVFSVHPYWTPHPADLLAKKGSGYFSTRFPLSAHDAADRLEELCLDSVKRRLVADVPVGVFLSGGIDSSTIAALAARVHSDRVKTFSVGFDDPSFDETPFALAVARHLGTDHHHRTFTAQDLLTGLDNLLDVFDEPFGDASIIPTSLLSVFARAHVTVALAGDGGDELFAGYPTYLAHKMARVYLRVPRLLRSSLVAPVVRRLPVSKRNFSFDFKAKRFLRGIDLPLPRRHMTWMGSFTPADLRALLLPDRLPEGDLDAVYRPAENAAALAHTADPLLAVQHIDLANYLREDILVKTDRSSMATSLEVRVPFLDHRIVEFALALPSRWKLHGLTTKWLLKKIALKYLPPRIVHRPKKGFGIPVARWLDGELRDWAHDLLAPDRLRRQNIFQPAAVQTLLDDHHAGRADNRKPLWTLLAFQIWHTRYMENP